MKFALAVFAYIIVAGLVYWGVAFYITWAEKHRVLDVPNTRSSHQNPKPRGGGIVILGVTVIIGLARNIINPILSLLPSVLFVTGVLLVAAVSWIDDIKTLPSHIRLLVHCVSALLSILAFGYWRSINLPIIGLMPLKWWGILLTLVWLVYLINLYNFMDGIDGIAGGQAVVAGLAWTIFGTLTGQGFVSLLGFLISAASLGFLGHNWSPSRVFLGDVGSTFLGYVFGNLALAASHNSHRVMLFSIFTLWPFIFDATFTIFQRAINKENIFTAHRSHLYQRLIIAGKSHSSVALLYIFLALICGGLGLIWYLGFDLVAIMLALLISLSLWVYTLQVEKAKL